MKCVFQQTFAAAALLLLSAPASAHFGMVIPSTNIATQETREIGLTLSFSHPFEGIGMDLVKPKRFFVVKDNQSVNLIDQLTQTQVMDHTGWTMSHRIQRPGVYHYVMEPTPYWEPAEDLFIIHYTKSTVAAFGADEGWDAPLGLPMEIVPLLRPYGNYQGNTFSGRVLIDGTPATGAEVEVEYYSDGATLQSPTDYHITQLVKADDNGIFSFACPLSGWWGFSALSEADYTITGQDKVEKAVELGAVLWIYLDSLP
ncbi:MAG TPA: DUF4198 domain-containing protein [Desulfopila sp.]|nr:DUF4198 domain-containing protein [Desulfopila sp.]